MVKSTVEKTWGRDVLSLEWKREGVIDGDRGGDDSVDPSDIDLVLSCQLNELRYKSATARATFET